SIDRGRSSALFGTHDIVETDPTQLRRRNNHSLQTFNTRSIFTGRPHANVVLVHTRIERRDLGSSDQRIDRLGNVSDPYTKVSGLVSINNETNFRFARNQR